MSKTSPLIDMQNSPSWLKLEQQSNPSPKLRLIMPQKAQSRAHSSHHMLPLNSEMISLSHAYIPTNQLMEQYLSIYRTIQSPNITETQMNKIKSSQRQSQISRLSKLQMEQIPSNSQQTNHLYNLIPNHIRTKYAQNSTLNITQRIYICLKNLHHHPKTQQLTQLFEQIGAEMNVWVNKSSPQQKGEYLLTMLEKSVQEGLKKINTQASPYLSLIQTNRKQEKNGRLLSEKQKSNQFDWLVLNTKNEMLKSKLKTKLVQTINQFKNEKKLREVMGKQLQDHEKIHLEDESIDLYQDDKTKMNYEWTIEDEQMFLHNIKMLKDKFTQTEFLKNCHRYKFITYSELKTLAAQQISRRLDKSNKAFLSRQFLLDKYFSSKQNLSQKQMKFILKTSPLLSRCVDKTFVRAAIKNIQYQDIDKMELQIAEEIIEKFEMIRNLVKSSRKVYKQKQNNKVKRRIQIFEKQKQENFIRTNMEEKLNHHKTKMIRNLNYRPNTAKVSAIYNRNKQNSDSISENQFKTGHKFVWPVPLNSNHPATGLFIKDCSQQLNDEFNEYEKRYIKNVQKNQDQSHTKKSPDAQAAMMRFYTGGPMDTPFQNKTMTLSSTCTSSFMKVGKKYKTDQNVIKAICETFKTSEYRKDLVDKLNSVDLIDSDEDETFTDKRAFSFGKSIIDFFLNQPTKRTKKLLDDQDINIAQSQKISNSTEKVIKDKIIQGKQKAKMKVYVKKLLSLAAQNSFLSLKALNAKFTPSQINTVDSKGNTALFYATKHKNSDFIDYLISNKADVNIKCAKGATPLHNAFRSSNYSIICKCLLGAVPPNLNVVDDDGKTPLAYCCRKILEMLGLQDGVVSIVPGQKLKFNNTSLLCLMNNDSIQQKDKLQVRFDLKTKNIQKQKQSINL